MTEKHVWRRICVILIKKQVIPDYLGGIFNLGSYVEVKSGAEIQA